MFRTLVPAAALALGLAAPLATPAAALPVPAGSVAADLPITQVYGGCGPYGHRGPWGYCRRGGQWSGYAPRRRFCPPGFHLGPYGRRCWPNRY